MLVDLAKGYASEIASIQLLLTLVSVILHLIFAAAVAKDAGTLNKTSNGTVLTSGVTWAFATLIGGVVVAAIYWFIHHSTLTRP